MSETKTEAKPRAPFKWLIPIQTSKTTTTFGRPELQAACRGSEDMAIQLNYFAYEASSEAQNNKIDIEQVDFIRITRSQDEIMKGILNCVSKKTHIKQMDKFAEWGFIKSDAYHHIYDIYFKKIAEVIANPPPAEKRKPRGRHVSQKVKSTNSDVKSTNCKLEDEIVPDCTFNPNEEMVNLQNQIVKLQFEMVNLQNQIVKLQFAQSYESAPHLALSGFCNDADSIDYNRLLEIGNYVVAHANNDTPIFSFPVADSEMQVSDESFKLAVLDDWRVYRPSQKITTSSQALEQILNRFSTSSSELSTPVVDTPSENVENVEPTQQSDIPTDSKQAESYSQQATQNAPAVVGDALPSEQKPARPPRERKPAAPKPEKQAPEPIILTPEEQAFYDLHCSMPWTKVAPDITLKVKEQCKKLAPHLKTQEQMYSLQKWMKKDSYCKGKGYALGMLLVAINQWASDQEPIDLKGERDDIHRNTAINAGANVASDPEKEAKMKAGLEALAKLKELEQKSKEYPGARVAG